MWYFGHLFHNIIKNDESDDIYKSLQSDDHSEVVMKLYEKLKRRPLEMNLKRKSIGKSDACRRHGNEAFKLDCYSQALMFYNMALCYAPRDSRSLKLAYSKRSALLFELQEYKDALKDIAICYQLGCPADLERKLKVREAKCHQLKHINNYRENISKDNVSSINLSFLEPFHNNEVPFATRAVKLDTSRHRPTVVAAEDINIGTVIALETAFVSSPLFKNNLYWICYNCMKASLNLYPCDNCCLVMFCSEDCKSMAFEDYHVVECKLLREEHINFINLTLKAVINMKKKCNTWDKFIEVINEILNANESNKKLKPENLYSHTNPFSLLHNTTDTYVPFGKKASRAALTAQLIKDLDQTGSYFPAAQDEKLTAIRATAKLLMHLFLYTREIHLAQTAIVLPKNENFQSYFTNSFYIFLSKLEHCCNANVIVVAMNNKAVVTAIQPIKRGTPITISYAEHYFLDGPDRELYIYGLLGTVCSCQICTEKWGKVFAKGYKLSPAQEKLFREINFDDIKITCKHYGFDATYQKVCLGLKLFADLPNTMEYKKFFMAFKNFQEKIYLTETKNKILLNE